MIRVMRSSTRLQVGLIALFAWLALYLFVDLILDFDLMYDLDSWKYLLASQGLGAYPPLELPAYPAAVALLNAILPFRNPVVAAQVVALAAYVASVLVLFEIFQVFQLRYALQFTLLFAFFPLVGLSNSIMPRVNSLVFFVLFVAIYFYVRDRRWYAVAALALCLLTHKSLWPLVLLFTAIAVIDKRLTLPQAAAVYIPLIAYWLAGSQYHSDLLWLLRESVQVKVGEGVWMPFYGLTGALRRASESPAQAIRAGVFISFLVVQVVLLLSRVWSQHRWLLALILTPLVWSVVINSHEYWSVYLYSSYVVIPLCFYVQRHDWAVLRGRVAWPAILGLSLASQWAFAAYFAGID